VNAQFVIREQHETTRPRFRRRLAERAGDARGQRPTAVEMYRMDLNLRTLDDLGVHLLGHLDGASGRRARFRDDLGASVAWGDERHGQLRDLFTAFAAERGLPAPEMPEPGRIDVDVPNEVDLAGFGAVLFAGGFRPDYGSWVDVPGAFDDSGFPVHRDGASTVAPGLHFVGVHLLRSRKSALFLGAGEDAAVVADAIAAAA